MGKYKKIANQEIEFDKQIDLVDFGDKREQQSSVVNNLVKKARYIFVMENIIGPTSSINEDVKRHIVTIFDDLLHEFDKFKVKQEQ